MDLITAPHLDAPDDFYAALIDVHRDLDSAASHALNARLVLLLANHIGALAVLRQALAAARVSAPLSAPQVASQADNDESAARRNG